MSLDFVIPALRVLLGLKPLTTTAYPLRVMAGIQFNQNAGFRIKPGMTAFIITLLFIALWLPLTAYAAKNILVLGDSLSAGYGIAAEKSWVSLLQQELSHTHADFHVINASTSGETAQGGRQRIAGALKLHRPAIVIVALGANDGLRGYPPTAIEANLGEIIKQAQRANAKVLLVGMKLPPNYGKAYVTKFQNIFPRLAKTYRVRLLPFLLEGLAADHFQPDNLHPTAPAQPLILRNVLQQLKPLLN